MARQVDKRSRALRRNLRKQARKGTLSAREQQDLLTQEARFRKAARQRRPYTLGLPLGVGAGLGAAALLGGDIFSRLGGAKGDGTPSGDPEQTPKVDPGAEMVPNRATMEEYERLKKLEELEMKGPKQIQQTVDESRELQTGGPGVGETASEPASDEAAETAESPEEKTRTEAELLDALTVFDGDTEPRPLPRIEASPIEGEGMVRSLATGPAGIDPLASLGPSAIESAKRLLDYPTYEVPFRELSPKEYRKLSRDEKRAYNDALEEYRFSGPEVRGAFPFRPTQVDAGPSAAEERREALQPELERRRQENTAEYPNREPASSVPVDPRLEAALGLRPMTDMERVEMLRRGVSANAQRERDAILADQARRAAAARAAGVSGIPYRQAMGGKNPSTAKLMKRIKAKYGMK